MKFRSARAFTRQMLRSPSGHLLEMLLCQANATSQGIAAVRKVVLHRNGPEGGQDEVVRWEQRGDDLRKEFVAELRASFVTPIDREDMFRVSRSIDDVLDYGRDFLQCWDLFAVEGTTRLDEMLACIEEGMSLLSEALALIEEAPDQALRGCVMAKRQCNQARREYQQAIVEVLTDPITAEQLKLRELLRRLDVGALRLGEAADALADGVMKRN